MEIPIPGKDGLYIETGPSYLIALVMWTLPGGGGGGGGGGGAARKGPFFSPISVAKGLIVAEAP